MDKKLKFIQKNFTVDQIPNLVKFCSAVFLLKRMNAWAEGRGFPMVHALTWQFVSRSA